MHIYDLLLWLVFVNEVVCAVLEVLAEAGETVVSLSIYVISVVISSQLIAKKMRNSNKLGVCMERIHEFTIWEQ